MRDYPVRWKNFLVAVHNDTDSKSTVNDNVIPDYSNKALAFMVSMLENGTLTISHLKGNATTVHHFLKSQYDGTKENHPVSQNTLVTEYVRNEFFKEFGSVKNFKLIELVTIS